jgi:hypothetical protein
VWVAQGITPDRPPTGAPNMHRGAGARERRSDIAAAPPAPDGRDYV